jgi:endonuclease YncB( thermonuclease family)
MIEKILNFFCVIVFLCCCCFFYEVATPQITYAQSGSFRVKSHLVFDKNFSGKGFALDGDSIRVGKKEVRLFGLDAPEYKQQCLDGNNKEYSCGIASHDFLTKLATGKKVECFYAEKDKYDRFLGKCFVGDVSINEEIVKNGMAVIYNFTESSEKMDNLEKEAKNNKIGIWQGAFELPKDYRKHNARK